MIAAAPCPPRSLRNAVASYGLPTRWADRVAEHVTTQTEADAVYRLLEVLDRAGALSLLLMVLDRGMALAEVESLLRAAGATDDRPMHPDALSAVRERLLTPYRSTPAQRSAYLECRHA